LKTYIWHCFCIRNSPLFAKNSHWEWPDTDCQSYFRI